MSLKSQVMAAAALKTLTFSVRGVDLTVRELSLAVRTELINATKDDPAGSAAVLVEHCLIDENGAPMFSREEVQQLPAELVEAIAEQAMTVSGMKRAAEKDEKKD